MTALVSGTCMWCECRWYEDEGADEDDVQFESWAARTGEARRKRTAHAGKSTPSQVSRPTSPSSPFHKCDRGLDARLPGAKCWSYADTAVVEQRLSTLRGGGGRERRGVWSASDQCVGNSYSVLLRDGSWRALAVMSLVDGYGGCTHLSEL